MSQVLVAQRRHAGPALLAYQLEDLAEATDPHTVTDGARRAQDLDERDALAGDVDEQPPIKLKRERAATLSKWTTSHSLRCTVSA
jgi:hypothetical protein